jgi:hypothetical protein
VRRLRGIVSSMRVERLVTCTNFALIFPAVQIVVPASRTIGLPVCNCSQSYSHNFVPFLDTEDLSCSYDSVAGPLSELDESTVSLFTRINQFQYHLCTLVQALRLCTGRTAHRGSRGIALLFHDHGTRRWRGVSVTPRPLFTPGKTRYPLYRRLGGLPGRSGQVRKIPPPTGIRSPDRPARSQSLYRLRYPAHILIPYCVLLPI